MKQAVINRLRELAQGAAPKHTFYGVCNDLALTVLPKDKHTGQASFLDKHDLYAKLGSIFLALGYPDAAYPLGQGAYSRSNLWEGESGASRRKLAQQCADYLETHDFV